jgi:hypothetical protein
MSDNPLMRGGQAPGRVSRDMLEAYCDQLNRAAFVVQSGKPYFIAERVINDQKRACLERNA